MEPEITEKKRINLFYPLGVMLLAMASYASFYFWYPRTEQTAVTGVIDAPTVVTEVPAEATSTETTRFNVDLVSSTTTPFPEATSSVVVSFDAPPIEEKKPVPTASAKKNITTPVAKKSASPKSTQTPESDLATKLLNDRLPPSTPQDLVVQSLAAHEVAISWSPSLDNSGVVAYKIFRDGELVALSTKSLQVFTGLTAHTKYTFGVVAYDQSGNMSKMNNILAETLVDPLEIATPPPAPPPVATPPVVSLCGNGVQNAGEECDDGNTNDHDMCTSRCKAAYCGDGILNVAIEQCDDGNQRDGDYCTNQCRNHTPTAEQIRIWGLTEPTVTPGN